MKQGKTLAVIDYISEYLRVAGKGERGRPQLDNPRDA